MPLKKKLIILFVAFTLIPLVAFGSIIFFQARDILQAVRIAQLNSIVDLKKDKIETFFNERKADIWSAQNFYNIRRNLPVLIGYQDDRTNPEYLKAKKMLDDQIKTFQQASGYLDLLLTDKRGRVVYVSNAEHAAHLGRPLVGKNTYEEGKKEIFFSDVFINEASGNQVEMIGVAPVRDLWGAFAGEVAIEIDMAPIFRFLQDTTGLGTTGEALIARREGNETLFLNPLRHDPNAALKRVVAFDEKTTVPAQKAARGENGSGITYDYNGQGVLAAWRYIPFLRWGLVTKIDAVEAFAPVERLKTIVLSVAIFLLLIGSFVARTISRKVTSPLLSLQKGAEAIAAGDLNHRVGTAARDEIGQLSRAFDVMTDAIEHRVRERTLELERAVAERKDAEHVLKLANAYNRSLIEASLDPLVTIDASGKITDVNVATEKVTGRSREDLMGADFSNYFTEPAKAEAGYQQVFTEGSVKDYALEIRHRDGRVTPVLYNASLYKNESGEVVGVFAAARDITERKRAEEIARQEEARNSSILRISQYPAASLRELLDFALDEAIALSESRFGYLYFYNEDTRDFTLHAWSKEVMAECAIADPQTLYHLDKTGIWGEVVRQRKPVIVNDFSAPHPLKKGYPEGHAPLFRFFSTPVFSEGRIVAVVGLANKPVEYTDRDVSETTLMMDSVWKIVGRKQVEEEIRKLNRELEARVVERTALLEAANKELEAFAYSVSHDLRTPLRGIDGFSLALLEDYADQLDAEGKDYLQRVRAAAVKMGQLIDALLNLSRLTRGELKRATVDLSALAKTAIDELRKAEPGRQVECIVSEGAIAQGDPVMLRAVIDNLFANAWKFTGKGDAARIEFGVSRAGGKPVYFVRDNGPGFDMIYVNKLFTAFQRLHGMEEFPGLGIGLATVQRIIHRHGGRVWAEGAVKKGATFYFTLS